MLKKINIIKFLRMLIMAGLVVFMLAACNSNDQDNKEQAPLEAGTQTFDATNCWQTEVVNVLYDLMGQVSIATYKKMTGGALALMMFIFALWMTKKLLGQLGSFKDENMSKVWTEIVQMFFLCLVCGGIASNANLLIWVLGDIIFPVYNAFLEFAGEILKVATPEDIARGNIPRLDLWRDFSVAGIEVDGRYVGGFALVSSQHPIVCSVSKIEFSGDPTGFPDSPKQMMDCLICSISHSLSFGIAVAMDAMTKAGIVSWLVGFFVLACFLFVKLSFVFYLVDTIFRFTVMVVMLPIMIMGFPFKKSRGVLANGVKNMLNSAGFMLFFSIIITMCIQALRTILETFSDVFAGDAPFADLGIPFICMMMIAFLVISSLQIAGKLCDSFVGGKSNSDFQKDAKALIIGAAKWIGSLGLKFASVFVPSSLREGFDNKMQKFMHIIGKDKEG